MIESPLSSSTRDEQRQESRLQSSSLIGATTLTEDDHHASMIKDEDNHQTSHDNKQHFDDDNDHNRTESRRSFFHDFKNSIAQYVNLLVYNRRYMWLFLSSIISVTGNTLSQIAIYSIIEQRTANQSLSGLSVSAILWCFYIPPVLMIPFSGVTADLFDQRYVMLISDLLRALIVPLFLLVSFFGMTHYILYGVLAGVTAINAFFDPCKDSLVPVVVTEKSDILVAKSLDSLTWMFCSFIGSSLGGLVTSLAGPSVNFILDSITFLLSSFCVLQMCLYKDFFPKKEQVTNHAPNENSGSHLTDENHEIGNEPQPIDTRERKSKLRVILHSVKVYVKEMFKGFIFLFKNPYLLSLCLLKSSGALCWSSIDIISLKYSDKYFRIGKDASAMLGITRALMGLSAGLTPVIIERAVNLVLRWRKRRRLARKVANGEEITEDDKNFEHILWDPKFTRALLIASYGSVAWGFGLILLSAKKYVALFLLAHIFIGMGTGTIWTFSTTCIYLVCPGEYMGRVMSVDFGFLHSAAVIICITISGVIFDKTGSVTQLVSIMLIALLVVMGVWCVWAIAFRQRPHITIQLSKGDQKEDITMSSPVDNELTEQNEKEDEML